MGFSSFNFPRDNSVDSGTIKDGEIVNADVSASAAIAGSKLDLSSGTGGDIDTGTDNITTGGILKIDVDGTAENAAGSLTLGAGNDAGMFFDGTDLVIITNGAGASGIILDSEDDTLEIKGSGTLLATFNTSGLDLAASDALSFGGVSIISDSSGTTTLSNIDALDATTESTIEAAIDTLANLTSASALVTVGALNSGSIATGFGAIDNGTSNITTGGIFTIDVDGTALAAAGSITMGAGNDAGMYFDGTDLIIMTDGAGASGIILDSEDDTLEIKGSGTLLATFNTSGLDLAASDNLSFGGVNVLADSAGTMTLSNIDALDATTESTIEAAIDTLSNLTTVGALNAGSITSGFGTIDNGASAITTTGTITGGLLNVDNVRLDSDTISYAGTGGITLNSDGSHNSSLQPCVLAYNSVQDDNVTGNGTSVTVDFDTEVTDQGGDFASDTFTAPVAGNYAFAVNVTYAAGTGANSVRLDVITSNRTYRTHLRGIDASGNAQSINLTGIADMDAADTMTAQLTIWGMAGDTADIKGGATLETYISVQLIS
jgi:hypothetical protein